MNEKIEVSTFDVADHLRTPEKIALFLEACFEDSNGDPAFIARDLGISPVQME